MSAAKKVEDKEASLSGIILMGAIVAGIGAFLGFLFLASETPKSYKSVAELETYLKKNPDLELLDRSYFKGPVANGRSWEQKRDVLLNGSNTTVEFSAGEINAWMVAKFRQPKPESNGEGESGVTLIPGVPNCFIDATEGFFFNLPTKASVYGDLHDCTIVVAGHFSAGPLVTFEMDSIRVNNAAVPLIGDQLVEALLSAYAKTDEFVAVQGAWQKVESVELVADSIRLKLR